jgi:hypothetical protein
MWWRAGEVRAHLRPLFARSSWEQTATLKGGTAGVEADQASVRLVGDGTAGHYGVGNDR